MIAVDTPRPLAASLTAVPADAARLQRAVQARLARLDGAPWLTVPAAPAAGPWLVDEDGRGLALLALGGEILPLHAERVDALADALDRAAPRLGELEAALGIAFEPVAAVRDAPAGLCAALEWRATGDHLQLILPHDTQLADALPAAVPPSDALPLAVTLNIAGPRLPLADAASLMPGDLLLLGQGWVAAQLLWTDHAPRRIDGLISMTDGRFRPGELAMEKAEMTASDGPVAAEDAAVGDGGAAGFRVPVELRLAARALPYGELQRLQDGALVDLGPVGAGIDADLLVAGRVIARGELVTVGDRLALLIDTVSRIGTASDAG